MEERERRPSDRRQVPSEGVLAIGREPHADRSGLGRLSPRDRRVVLAFLRQAPARNAYLLAQIARGALGRDDLAGPIIGHWSDGELDGIAIFGSNLVLSMPCSAAACGGFAEYARTKGFRVWVAVGEDALIASFMASYGRNRRPIVMERVGQRLYALSGRPEGPGESSQLRAADIREAEALMRVDRAMVVEELGFDPFSRDLDGYRRGWHSRIREGRSWIVTRDGEIVFKVDHSASSDDVVQLAGIYTVPSHRRQGIAREAISAMCWRLLRKVPLVTLYVDADNTPAIRLYEALGFESIGLVRSVWFAD